MKVGNLEIGYDHPTFVIAEICSNIINHLHRLIPVIQSVAETGATGIKCQLFKVGHFPESERDAKRLLEFPRNLFPAFVELAHANKLLAGASVFDAEAVQLCVDNGADFLKLATREFQNNVLLAACIDSNLPIFQSYDSNLYPHGLMGTDCVLRLACDPHYPSHTPKIIGGWSGDEFFPNDNWGWSSHTNTHWIDCLIAVSRRACVIEKHIGFHRDDLEMGWSLYPDQFRKMVEEIRMTEKMR